MNFCGRTEKFLSKAKFPEIETMEWSPELAAIRVNTTKGETHLVPFTQVILATTAE